MFCALLTSRYQVSVYRTNGPLVFVCCCYICDLVHNVEAIRGLCQLLTASGNLFLKYK